MQLQGLMFMLIALIIAPILMISLNHNVFFVVVAFILLITSIKNIYSAFFIFKDSSVEEENDFVEELEEEINLDVKRFEAGVRVVKDLIIILFFLYCYFYVSSLWLKLLVPLIVLNRLYDAANGGPVRNEADTSRFMALTGTPFLILVNIFTVILIVFTGINKFFKITF